MNGEMKTFTETEKPKPCPEQIMKEGGYKEQPFKCMHVEDRKPKGVRMFMTRMG